MATTPAKSAAPKSPAKPATSKPAPSKPTSRARTPRSRKAAPAKVGAWSTGAAVLAIGAGIAGFLARRQIAAWVAPGSAEHEAPDLALGQPLPGTTGRAPVDFRPDMDAPISPAEREGLRPATGPAPSMVAEAGTMNAQTGA